MTCGSFSIAGFVKSVTGDSFRRRRSVIFEWRLGIDLERALVRVEFVLSIHHLLVQIGKSGS